MFVQALVSEAPIEAFDEAVLSRLPGWISFSSTRLL